MALFNNFKIGIGTYKDAHKLIVKEKLWWYILLPGLINVVLISTILLIAHFTGNALIKYLFDFFGISKEYSGIIGALIAILRFILKIIVYFLFFSIYSYSYKYIILMIISPALAILSEKTDELITNQKYPFSFKQLLKDIIRGCKIVLRNMIIEFLFIIAGFILSFIPIIGYICPVILFLISMYFYGFSMIDYSNERERLNVKQSVKFIRKNKGFAIANGLIFYCLMLIPLVGILIAPSYSVIAATIGTQKIKQNVK